LKKKNKLTKSFTAFIQTSQAKLASLALLSLIVTSSCSDPSSVGLELDPGNNQVGVFFVNFELPAEVVLLDSFNTTNQDILVVGNEEDSYFGKTTSTGYSRMHFSTSATKPESNAILDSVMFDLSFVSINGQNLDEAKTYSIHQLTEQIQDTVYYNFDKIPFEETPFASTQITFGEVKDTINTFHVEEEFGIDLFDKLKRSSVFDNIFTFREYFPGIAVQAKEGENSTAGIETGADTKLSFFYHYEGDTVATSFEITTSSSRNFNGIESNRTGTPTEIVQELNESYETGSLVGMKAGLGMAIRLDTSPLDAFLDTLSGVVFKQANLLVGEIEEVPEGQNPTAAFVAYFVDANNKIIRRSSDGARLTVQRDGQPQTELVDEDVEEPAYSAYATGTFNTDSDIYIMGITSHVNALFRKELTRKDWMLYGGYVSTVSADEFKRSLRQLKVGTNKIEIQAIYSKIQ
jgi:hypothetical protein